jgi:signal transduction histidine kinase
VRVRASHVDGYIHIDVIDSGPGVAPEHREHLMQPFYTTKPLGAGMGVGLSLSRTIAQDHNGMLELADVDGHTCFRLSLPSSLNGTHGGRTAISQGIGPATP